MDPRWINNDDIGAGFDAETSENNPGHRVEGGHVMEYRAGRGLHMDSIGYIAQVTHSKMDFTDVCNVFKHLVLCRYFQTYGILTGPESTCLSKDDFQYGRHRRWK